MSFLKKLIFILVCCVLPIVSHANYTITPVKVQIKPNSMMSSLKVHNNNDKPRHFQISVYQVAGDTSKKSEVETKDLVVSPAMFQLAGKKVQTIRVAIKNADAAFKNKYYILSIKELPHGKVEANSVRVVTDFRVPILVGEDSDKVGAKGAK